MHQIWQVESTPDPEKAFGPKSQKFIIQDGRRPPYWNFQKLNNSRTVSPILTKFGTDLHLDTAQRQDVSNHNFSKSKMAADEKLKFTKNWITSKRYVLYAPNLVCIIHFTPGTSMWSQNVEIHNPRWPPAAILKFTKTWITPEVLIWFSPNLARSFALTPPRHRMCQNRIFFFKIQDGRRRKTENY